MIGMGWICVHGTILSAFLRIMDGRRWTTEDNETEGPVLLTGGGTVTHRECVGSLRLRSRSRVSVNINHRARCNLLSDLLYSILVYNAIFSSTAPLTLGSVTLYCTDPPWHSGYQEPGLLRSKNRYQDHQGQERRSGIKAEKRDYTKERTTLAYQDAQRTKNQGKEVTLVREVITATTSANVALLF